MGLVHSIISQSFFLPQPTLTEKNLGDQSGKVHLVTGGYAGCGFELAKFLYQNNATVYIAGRSTEKATKAIEELKSKFPDSKGKVEFLKLDLSDLSTIKPAAEEFMSKESRLDVLTNNAGVMVPPSGSKDTHGHELQMGTNVLGPFCLTTCLLPVIEKTAASAPEGAVRVTWASSLAVEFSPKDGVAFDSEGAPTVHSLKDTNYAQSKAANTLLASEFAARHPKDKILSVSWNPGNLKSELQRHTGIIQKLVLETFLLFPAAFGGYTELYAACSPDVTMANNGAYIGPWGRVLGPRDDVVGGMKIEAEGGTGTASKLWAWCEKETAKYV